MGAVLMGLVQGFTEFLPVSSSGHLLLLRTLLHVASPGATLEVWLHGATLASVLIALRRRLGSLLHGVLIREPSSVRIVLMVALGTLPAALAGVLLRHQVDVLFRPQVAAVGFLLTSLLLWTAPRPSTHGRRLDEIGTGDALLVGAVQALALIPGLSRSASTMAASRWCGLSPATAAEYSFLLAIPVILGALVVTGIPEAQSAPVTLIAALTAGTAGVLAVQWAMQGIVKPGWWKGFGVYTIMLAGLSWWLGR